MHALLERGTPGSFSAHDLLAEVDVPNFHSKMCTILSLVNQKINCAKSSAKSLPTVNEVSCDIITWLGEVSWHENTRFCNAYMPLWPILIKEVLYSGFQERRHWEKLRFVMSCDEIFGDRNEATDSEGKVAVGQVPRHDTVQTGTTRSTISMRSTDSKGTDSEGTDSEDMNSEDSGDGQDGESKFQPNTAVQCAAIVIVEIQWEYIWCHLSPEVDGLGFLDAWDLRRDTQQALSRLQQKNVVMVERNLANLQWILGRLLTSPRCLVHDRKNRNTLDVDTEAKAYIPLLQDLKASVARKLSDS